MVNKITDIKTLIKYLEYLLDYSDLIYSQNNLTENLYKDLKKEAQFFYDRVSNT